MGSKSFHKLLDSEQDNNFHISIRVLFACTDYCLFSSLFSSRMWFERACVSVVCGGGAVNSRRR